MLLITVQPDVEEERSMEKLVIGNPLPPGIVQLNVTEVAPIVPPKFNGAFGLTEVIGFEFIGVGVGVGVGVVG